MSLLMEEIRYRLDILTWAIGALSALVAVTLGNLIVMAHQLSQISHQLGQINGELAVMINHLTLK